MTPKSPVEIRKTLATLIEEWRLEARVVSMVLLDKQSYDTLFHAGQLGCQIGEKFYLGYPTYKVMANREIITLC